MKLGGKDNPDVVANAAVYFCINGDRSAASSTCCRRRRARSTARPDVAYANAGRCARGDGRPKDAEQ